MADRVLLLEYGKLFAAKEFSGVADGSLPTKVRDFIHFCTTKARLVGIPTDEDNGAINAPVSVLVGPAASWWLGLAPDARPRTLTLFGEALSARFLPANHDMSMALKLITVPSARSPADLAKLCTTFQEALSYLPSTVVASEHTQLLLVASLLSKLPEVVLPDFRARPPGTMAEAIVRIQAFATTAPPTPVSTNVQGLRRRGTTTQHGPALAAPASTPATAPKPGPPARPAHVTEAEYVARLRAGVCVGCGMAGHLYRACVTNKNSAYLWSLASDSLVCMPSALARQSVRVRPKRFVPRLQPAAPNISSLPQAAGPKRPAPSPPPCPPPPPKRTLLPFFPPGLTLPAAVQLPQPVPVAQPAAVKLPQPAPLAAPSLPRAPSALLSSHIAPAPPAPLPPPPSTPVTPPAPAQPVLPNAPLPLAPPSPPVTLPAPAPLRRSARLRPPAPSSVQAATVSPLSPPAAPTLPHVATPGMQPLQPAPVARPQPDPVACPPRKPAHPVRIHTNLHRLDHTLLTLRCSVGSIPVMVLFDPGSTHNLISSAISTSLALPPQAPPVAYELKRAGASSSSFSSAPVLFPLSFPRTHPLHLPFLDHVEAIPVPAGLAPYEILLGKPWFASQPLDVDWKRNLLSVHTPSYTHTWTATVLPDLPDDPDCDTPADPATVDLNLNAAELEELILTPHQAARVLRKPGQARIFVAFPREVPQLEDVLASPTPISTNVATTTPTPGLASATPHAPTLTEPDTSATPGPSPDRLSDISLGRDAPPALRALLARYRDVFDELPPGIPPDRGAPFSIDTAPGADPPARPPYRLSHPERVEMQRQLKSLISLGFISPTISPYAAPVFFVIKPDGKLRMVVDWRGLNAITVKNRVHLPNLDDLFDCLSNAKVFSKLDLASGFYQLPVRPGDRPKTAMITPFGNFEWNVMGMGLTNAPAQFQTLMERVLQPFLGKFVVVFIDDILIFSNDHSEHLAHAEAVLASLRSARLFAKPGKCYFWHDSILFLGHKFQNGTISVDDSKLDAVHDWPTPTSMVDLRRFVGLCNFFRRFMPKFSEVAAPLHDLIKFSQQHPGSPFTWTPTHQTAFDALKLLLTSPPTLTLPDLTRPFSVTTDASNAAISAVLTQDGVPVAYFSAKLSPAESLLETDERETLAVVRAFLHWRHYLWQHFTLRTDNPVVKHLMTKPNLTRRQAQWTQILADYDFDIVPIKGTLNIADPFTHRPDFLSMNNQHTTTTWSLPQDQADTIRKLYRDDPDAQHYLRQVRSSTQQGMFAVDNGLIYLLSPPSPVSPTLPQRRLYVPRPSRHAILRSLHDAPLAGHPGRDRMHALALTVVFWPGMAGDIQQFCRSCDICQRSKPNNRNPAAPLQPLNVPEQRWSAVSMDFMSGLPPSGPLQFDAILAVVDRFTKRVHFIPTHTSADAPATARLFLDHIVRLHGLPRSIVSDRDPRFTSLFWSSLCALLNISLDMSTANHPQTDGQTERAFRSVQATLRAYVDHTQADWSTHLACAEFSFNNLVNASTGFTPFFADLGFHPVFTPLASTPVAPSALTPAEVTAFLKSQHAVFELVRDSILTHQHDAMAASDRNVLRRIPTPAVGSLLLVSSDALLSPAQRDRPSRKLAFPWQGPFRVLSVPSPSTVRVELPRGCRAHPVVNVSLTKPYIPDPLLPAPPPPVLGPDDVPEYFVEAILSHRIRRGKPQFLVKWQGLGIGSNEWLNLRDLIDEEPELCINDALLQYALHHPAVRPYLPDWDWDAPL